VLVGQRRETAQVDEGEVPLDEQVELDVVDLVLTEVGTPLVPRSHQEDATGTMGRSTGS
jgi:hypothetical protein